MKIEIKVRVQVRYLVVVVLGWQMYCVHQCPHRGRSTVCVCVRVCTWNKVIQWFNKTPLQPELVLRFQGDIECFQEVAPFSDEEWWEHHLP